MLFALLFSTAAMCQDIAVDDPIYPQFEFSQLAPFQVGKLVADIPPEYKATEINLKNALRINQYYLTHLGYKFPIFIQYAETIILDLYVRLPSYLLHDFFHQTLINNYGMQQSYILKDSTAVYTWDSDGVQRVYSGGCTISCFPIFYTEINSSESRPADYRSLYQLLKESLVID